MARLLVKGALLMIAGTLLLSAYLFQKVDLLTLLFKMFGNTAISPSASFIFNKTCRLIVNDLACFLIILVVFQHRKYLRIAFYVFLVELLVILPVYFLLKLRLEGNSELSSPLLSQLHRLVVNPTLMILLIIGFFYQQLKVRKTV